MTPQVPSSWNHWERGRSLETSAVQEKLLFGLVQFSTLVKLHLPRRLPLLFFCLFVCLSVGLFYIKGSMKKDICLVKIIFVPKLAPPKTMVSVPFDWITLCDPPKGLPSRDRVTLTGTHTNIACTPKYWWLGNTGSKCLSKHSTLGWFLEILIW